MGGSVNFPIGRDGSSTTASVADLIAGITLPTIEPLATDIAAMASLPDFPVPHFRTSCVTGSSLSGTGAGSDSASWSRLDAARALVDGYTDAIAALKKHQNQCAAMVAVLVERLESSAVLEGSILSLDLWQRQHSLMGIRAELATLLQVPEGAAERLIEQAVTLVRHLPATLEAMNTGELGWDYAVIIAEDTSLLRVAGIPAAAVDAFEQVLLDKAQDSTLPSFREKARRQRERSYPETIIPRTRRAYADRHLRVSRSTDGMSWLSLYAPAPTIEGIWDQCTLTAQAAQGPHEQRTLTQLRADVAAALLLNQSMAHNNIFAPPEPTTNPESTTTTGTATSDGTATATGSQPDMNDDPSAGTATGSQPDMNDGPNAGAATATGSQPNMNDDPSADTATEVGAEGARCGDAGHPGRAASPSGRAGAPSRGPQGGSQGEPQAGPQAGPQGGMVFIPRGSSSEVVKNLLATAVTAPGLAPEPWFSPIEPETGTAGAFPDPGRGEKHLDPWQVPVFDDPNYNDPAFKDPDIRNLPDWHPTAKPPTLKQTATGHTPGTISDEHTIRAQESRAQENRPHDALPPLPPMPQVMPVVLMPALSLLGITNEPAWMEGAGPISMEVAKRLTAQAPSLYRVLVDPITNKPLDVAPDRYRVDKAMRTMLRIRDEYCQFPGCLAKAANCQVDHIKKFQSGGTTIYDNLEMLCLRHHLIKHFKDDKTRTGECRTDQSPERAAVRLRGWTPTMTETGIAWTSPSGRYHRPEPRDGQPPAYPKWLKKLINRSLQTQDHPDNQNPNDEQYLDAQYLDANGCLATETGMETDLDTDMDEIWDGTNLPEPPPGTYPDADEQHATDSQHTIDEQNLHNHPYAATPEAA